MGDRPPTSTGKTVILVDDGLATGASMFAAVRHCANAEPAQIVIAVPAAPESTCREFAGLVDDVVCASMPTPFLAVGESFWDFRQVSDDEVRDVPCPLPTGGATSRRRTEEPPPTWSSVPPSTRRPVIPPDGSARGADRRRAHRADRRELARHTRVLRGARRDHQVADRRERLHRRRRRGRLARRLPGQPLRARTRRPTPRPRRRCRGFERFPAWMWRNEVVRDFVDWLRWHNERGRDGGGRQPRRLLRSGPVQPAPLDAARSSPISTRSTRVRPPGPGIAMPASITPLPTDDGQAYGYAAAFGAGLSCEHQAVDQLVDVQRNALDVRSP